MLVLYFYLIALCRNMKILTLLVFVSDRGAYAKEESLETYINYKQQFGTETTTETNISPGIPAELDLRKRRAS